MLANTESLIHEMNRLHAYVSRVLERGETAGDDRLVLLGVSQGQRNVETLARIAAHIELTEQLANTPPLPTLSAESIRNILTTLIEGGAAISPPNERPENTVDADPDAAETNSD